MSRDDFIRDMAAKEAVRGFAKTLHERLTPHVQHMTATFEIVDGKILVDEHSLTLLLLDDAAIAATITGIFEPAEIQNDTTNHVGTYEGVKIYLKENPMQFDLGSLKLPRSRQETNAHLRFLYQRDPVFHQKVDDLSAKYVADPGYSEQVAHEFALFGEVFLLDGKVLNPDEVKVKHTILTEEPSFFWRGVEVQGVTHILNKASMYDVRGTSNFINDIPAEDLK